MVILSGLHSFRDSPNPLIVCIKPAMQIQEKVSIVFITSQRKTAKLFVMVLIEREIDTSREVLNTKSCNCNQFLFYKKDAFQKEKYFRIPGHIIYICQNALKNEV